jgi:DHA1 family inner membrane transport protein
LARLAAVAPELASASIALNTSLIYVGQAVGSGLGGFLFAQAQFYAVGYIGAAFSLASCVLLGLSWRGWRLAGKPKRSD